MSRTPRNAPVTFKSKRVASAEDILYMLPKKVAFYGGSFFPPHLGHYVAVDAALDEHVDLVVMCPHANNPSKDRVAMLAAMKDTLELVAIGTAGTHSPDRVVVADPSFLFGIQNTQFIELSENLTARGVIPYVLIGADSLRSEYPQFMRSMRHLIAPRHGYTITAEHILIGPYDVLQTVEKWTARQWKEMLTDHLRSGNYTPDELIAHHASDSSQLHVIGEACCDLGLFDHAERCFLRVVDLWQGSESVYEMGRRIQQALASDSKFNIPEEVRSAVWNLYQLSLKSGNIKMAEECLLNVTFDTKDPEMLVHGGVFYLVKGEPELDTAITYFRRACDSDLSKLSACDEHLRAFLKKSGWAYPRSILEACQNRWEAFKRERSAGGA